MARAAGILTAKAGSPATPRSSPAAGASPRWSARPRSQVGDRWVALGGRRFRAGDTITIDGGSGEVFEGRDPGRLSPCLRRPCSSAGPRARDPDRRGGAGRAGQPDEPARRGVDRRPDPRARHQGLRDCPGRRRRPGVDADQVQPLARRPRRRRPRELGRRRLPPHRHRQGARLRTGRCGAQQAWGADGATPHSMPSSHLDQRMKDTSSPPGSSRSRMSSTTTPTPDYDHGVLDRLAALHERGRRVPRCQRGWLTATRDVPASGSPRARPGRGGRRPLRRLTARRQLPRRLVRAPRGPDPARRPHPRGRGRRRPGIARVVSALGISPQRRSVPR